MEKKRSFLYWSCVSECVCARFVSVLSVFALYISLCYCFALVHSALVYLANIHFACACMNWIRIFEYQIDVQKIITITLINVLILVVIHSWYRRSPSLSASTWPISDQLIILNYSVIGMFRTHFTRWVPFSHFNDQSYEHTYHMDGPNTHTRTLMNNKMLTNRHKFTIKCTHTHAHRLLIRM